MKIRFQFFFQLFPDFDDVSRANVSVLHQIRREEEKKTEVQTTVYFCIL